MSYEIKIEKFSGPLDLLLQLIEAQKMPVTDIALAEVTEQYLIYLEKLENKDPEEVADFLVVAARLLLLKSKAILPILTDEVEPDELEKQLKIYKEFLEASKKVSAILALDQRSFAREKAPQKSEVVFSPPIGIDVLQLKNVFLGVLKRLDPLVRLPRQAIEKSISLQQKIFEIKNFLDKTKNFNFKTLMKDAKNRTEVIVNFLAILELLKRQHLRVKQNNNFQDIIIEKI